MKKILFILLVFISIDCFSQTKNFIDQNFIEVEGKAELEIIPNEIFLRILLNERDFKGKEDIVTVEEKMIEQLKKLGVDISKDLAVKDMASNLRKYWIKSSDVISIKMFQLKVMDAKEAGAVFQALESINISNIFIESIDHSEMQRFKQEVKIEAIKAAKQKAEVLVSAIGQTCGKAIYIKELDNHISRGVQIYDNRNTANIVIRGSSSLSQPEDLEIEFEKIKLAYSILVKFELN